MSSMDSSVEIIDTTDDGLPSVRYSGGFDSSTPSPRRPLLESVSARFEHNRKEREERVQRMRNKQETEKAHSQYLKRNVTSKYELDRARPIVDAWAQRNGRNRVELTQRQRQRIMELETVDRRNIPVRQQIAAAAAQDMSNNAADDYSENCSVIGCGIKFTCRQEHRIHEMNFEHSPCNPLLNMPNGCLPDHPLGYICPKCGESYQRSIDCKEHMVMSDHLSLFSPLSVCAYMCPQCLFFFPEKMRCHNHMEELHHFEPAYPFSADLTRDPTICPRTVPVPLHLGRDFIQKVQDRHILFSITCVECGLTVNNYHELQEHCREMEESHVFTSSTKGNLVEVFAEYLGDHTCSACLQIFKGPAPGDNIHHCTEGMQGQLVDFNCQSFSEFVCRSGLTLGSALSERVTVPRHGPSETVTVSRHVPVQDSSGNIPIIDLSSPAGSPVVSPEHIFHVSSGSNSSNQSSSNQSSSQEAPSKKRVHHVTILSSSSESECDEVLTKSARKRLKVDKSSRPLIRESAFSQKMKSLTSGLNTNSGSSAGFVCSAQNYSEEDSNSVNFRGQNEDSSCSRSPPESTQCEASLENKDKLFQNSLPNDRRLPTTLGNTFKDQNQPFKTSITGSQLSGESIKPAKQAGASTLTSLSTSQPFSFTPVHVQTKCHQTLPRMTTAGSARHPLCFVSKIPGSSALSEYRSLPHGAVSESHGTTPFSDSLASASGGASGVKADPQGLNTMKLIIFLDLDNWGGFFKKLPHCLPDKTFVWAFYGGKNNWKPPYSCVAYQRLMDHDCLHFHEQCGSSKDAADFAICLTVGKMDERLPKHIPFTILSGDKGFLEVERQMKLSTRRTVVIDPHNVIDKSNDVLYAMIVSVFHD